MFWIYGEWVNPLKWERQEVKDELTNTVYTFWESTAAAAGYTPVDGTATEQIYPMWWDSQTELTSDVAVEGVEPTFIMFQVTAEVVPTPQPEPEPEPAG